VATSSEEDVLSLSVDDDGAPRGDPLVRVADRVGALGGSVETGANAIRVELPCA
jgi:hypothetical protein